MLSSRALERPASILVAFLLAAVLVPLTAHTAQASTDPATQFVELINRDRAANGAGALAPRRDLNRVAVDHARVMASENRLHHNPDLASDVSNWVVLSENVGVGGSVSSLHSAFMSSTGHRANILDGRVTEIGVGVVSSGGRFWVVEVFRKPEVATQSATTSAPDYRRMTPIAGDWDGDGAVEVGYHDIRTATFHLDLDGAGPPDVSVTFGRPGWKPVTGDWDGDGQDGIGVVDGNRWYLADDALASRAVASWSFVYGRVGWVPVVGDWNGDGKTTPGMVHGNRWYLRDALGGGNADHAFAFGPWNAPIGVGRADTSRAGEGPAVRVGNTWYFRTSLSTGYADVATPFGSTSDVSLLSDWDGDGITTPAVVRGTSWYRAERNGRTGSLPTLTIG
ncbi:MAG: CAP domain-containing protein [Actinomycetes bacterium]